MQKLLFLTVTAAALALPRFAVAQEGPKPNRPDPEAWFKQMDKNADGVLTADEAPAERKEFFEKFVARADKNGDKKVDLEEFKALRKDRPTPEAMFKLRDKNADGVLTADEVPAERKERFEKFLSKADKNGDKKVDLEEFKAVFKEMAPRAGKQRPAGDRPKDARAKRGPRDGAPRKADGARHGHRKMPPMAKHHSGKHSNRYACGDRSKIDGKKHPHAAFKHHGHHGKYKHSAYAFKKGYRAPAHYAKGSVGKGIFERQDKNKDGKVTKDEAVESVNKAFEKFDTDKDGAITKDEVKQVFKEMAKKHAKKKAEEKKG